MTDEPECQLRRRKVSGNPNLPLNLDVEYLVSDGDPDQGTPSPSNIKRLARTKQKSSSSALLDYKNKQQSFDIQVEECEEIEIILDSEEDDEEENTEGLVDRGITPTPIQDFAANVVYSEVKKAIVQADSKEACKCEQTIVQADSKEACKCEQTIVQVNSKEAYKYEQPNVTQSHRDRTVSPQLSRIISGFKSLHHIEIDSPQYCRLFDSKIDEADTQEEASKFESSNACQCPFNNSIYRTVKPPLPGIFSGFHTMDNPPYRSVDAYTDQGPQARDFLRVNAVEQDCYTDVSDADTEEEENE